ncbi:membrane protein [Staphylococcus gallinarum]|uniref:Membrane protein n=1 Tax=Staphylococcus gallinarum TaxID=1293 RepID=A0A380FI58_STAGA|nr:membrane protein [Staphylococcus gallinarum]
MLSKYWKVFMISAAIISLISIKGFPMAIGALYFTNIIQNNKVTN